MANYSVVNDGVINAISIVAFFCVGFGLLRFVNRFETQWVSRDGLKFTAKVSLDSATSEKWIDVKVLVDGGWLIISGRGRREGEKIVFLVVFCFCDTSWSEINIIFALSVNICNK